MKQGSTEYSLYEHLWMGNNKFKIILLDFTLNGVSNLLRRLTTMYSLNAK